MPHQNLMDKPMEASEADDRPTRSSPTVEELLKLISGRRTSNGGSSNSNIHGKPPPIPPKPRTNIENCAKDSDCNVGERSFRRYFSSKSSNAEQSVVLDNSAIVGDTVSSFSFIRKKYDAYNSAKQHDNNEGECAIKTRPSLNTSNSAKYSQQPQHQHPRQLVKTINERFIDDPNLSTPKQTIATKMTTADYEAHTNDRDSNYSHVIKPIVTESPEEANNNNIIKRKHAVNNTSTVEILEVPYNKHKSQNTSTTTITYGNKNCNNPTFSRTHKQQFHENNSYATPVVTSATDDEDGDHGSDDDVTLPTEMEVESLLNKSASDHPPRTSTPNSESTQSHIDTSNIIHGGNDNNNQCYVKIVNMQASDYDKHYNNDTEDTANISRDTDEMASSSVLNQSGGGEIIGINENSDLLNNSKDSPLSKDTQDRTHYTVQVFNDSVMSPAMSPPRIINNCSQTYANKQSIKIDDLEKLTSSLAGCIDKLKSQVESLTSRVSELEVQSGQQGNNIKQLFARDNATSQKTEIAAPIRKFVNSEFAQSNSSINKLSSQTVSSNHQQHNSSHNPMSTYSRTQVATISRNSCAAHPRILNDQMSSSMNNNSKKLGPSQAYISTSSRPLKKTTTYASTNSLYADSCKSGSTSISPIPNYNSYRQSSSPSASTGDLLNKRNNPSAYNSMMSLCSIGQNSGSTLKKGPGVSESVSNLSQAGSQLSNWPSLSEFVPAKHRAKDVIYSAEERLIRMVLYNRLISMHLPSWVESNYDLEKVIEPPSARLKLDWVYGYRGRDCRSNLFYLPTGECVYFVASIVVLYNPDQKTQRHYLGHTESVKCLAVHPNKLIIASGQSAILNRRDKRPIVRVWNTVSLATLRVIGFNEDFDRCICCLAFSKHDQGATLAVVDESNEHTITLLDWQREKNWRIAETNSGHEPVLAIDFHPIDKYSLVAVGKSTINFWDTRGMTMAKKAGLFDKYDKPKYVLCLTFNDLGDTITGDSNGNVIIWPRGGNRPRRIIHDAHLGGVFSVLAMKDGSYLTGGRDRRIVEWDENFDRTGREAELPEHCGGVRYITYARGSQVLIGTLRNCILLGSLANNFVLIMQGHAEATSSVAIHPNQEQYLTGGFDDQIHLFDTLTHDVVWSKCLMMPATAASFSPNGLLLVIGSTLGKWLVLDAVTQEILFTKCDGSGTISCIKFSPDGEYFCMGSSDFQIYVYQTTEAGNKFCRIGTCVGHTAPVKEIDWSHDSRYFQTQSLNFELLFWKAQNCRPLDDPEVIKDLSWFTHNCTLGFNVIGLWSDSIDSALINYCDKSYNEDLMASATDTGNINIFRWPPCYNQCLSQKYYGNVDKFNFIKFLPDDSRLIAIGAKNCVTTEWIVDKGE